MCENVNKIIAGHYKNNEIQLKGDDKAEIVLIIKKFLNKVELPMDKTTIKSCTTSQHLLDKHEIIIQWNDEKISQAIVDNALYSELCFKIRGEIC